METSQNKDIYEFGEFRINVKEKLLRHKNQLVALNLKEFEVLLVLVENAGQVVDKNDLLDAVWKDVFIEEGTLTRNISRLRKKLKDGGDNENFIETLPKRGYRFLPSVVKSDENAVIIEERTQMRVRVEETLTLSDAEMPESGNALMLESGNAMMERSGDTANENVELPDVSTSPLFLPAAPPRRRVPALLVMFGAIAVLSVGFLVYQNYFQTPASKTILATKITPFSGATGRENTPSFSPDGKQIAFAWNGGEDGGDFDIYVRLINAIEPVQLTDDKFDEKYPVFSPDGNSIAFVRSFPDHGEVVLIPALGGAERRIARLFSGFASISFAPDGQNIAVIDTEDSTDGKQYAVYLVDVATGARKRLTAPAEFAGETTPRFSPDGKSLAFVRVSSDKNQDLFIMPTTGGELRRITFDETIINSLAWSADGKDIFFVSYRGDTQPNVWRISANGGQPDVAISGRDISNIAVSPDDKSLVFVENFRNTNIWRVAADRQPAKKFAASIYSEQDANFSPDGSRVVFTSNRTGKFEIWVADASGKNLRQLTESSFSASVPRFSPDGSQVVYEGLTDQNSDIFTVSAEGGAARRLTENAARDFAPAWSADGKWIYFTSNRTGEMNIWKMPVSEGEAKAVQITYNGGYLAMPAPDGKTIFYRKAHDNNEMRRVPANGGAEEHLPEFARAGFISSWTMTQTGIYFLAHTSDEFLKIKFYDFADGEIKDVSGDYKIPDKVFENLDATGNGGVFLYSLLDQNAGSIMLAEIGE